MGGVRWGYVRSRVLDWILEGDKKNRPIYVVKENKP